jgi:hypothetical protein
LTTFMKSCGQHLPSIEGGSIERERCPPSTHRFLPKAAADGRLVIGSIPTHTHL